MKINTILLKSLRNNYEGTKPNNPSSPPSSTRSSQVTQKTLRDPSLPGDLTYLDTDYTVVSTTNSVSHL
mgnify:CR=1 FL=1